jgi:hypothetical protein
MRIKGKIGTVKRNKSRVDLFHRGLILIRLVFQTDFFSTKVYETAIKMLFKYTVSGVQKMYTAIVFFCCDAKAPIVPTERIYIRAIFLPTGCS